MHELVTKKFFEICCVFNEIRLKYDMIFKRLLKNCANEFSMFLNV